MKHTRLLAFQIALFCTLQFVSESARSSSSVFEKLEYINVDYLQFSMKQLELEMRLEELETCKTSIGCAVASSYSVIKAITVPSSWPADTLWYDDGMLVVRANKEYPNSQISEKDIDAFCKSTYDIASWKFQDLHTSKLNILVPDSLKEDQVLLQSIHDRLILIVEIDIDILDGKGLVKGQNQLVCGGSPASSKKWFNVITRRQVGQK
jgi:hypothetical protein